MLSDRGIIMDKTLNSRNIGLDLVRVTEAAALAAGRWIGSGNYNAAHAAATDAMYNMISSLNINGFVAVGEDRLVDGQALLREGQVFGDGAVACDLAVDPIDGTRLLIEGKPGAISVIAVAPRHSIWSAGPADYIDKLVVDRDAAQVLVPECMDAPAAWTLALVARAKKKAVRDLTIIILQRGRHQELIDEIRATGARILLREEGDAVGALEAAMPGSGVDILMGVGGASQGVLSACAVRSLRGGMLARLSPQSAEERAAVSQAGLDTRRVMTADDLVASDDIFFAATGITGTPLLPGISFAGSHAETRSLLIRAKTRTRRFIEAEYALEE